MTPIEETIQRLMEPDKHGDKGEPVRCAWGDTFGHPIQRTLDALWRFAEESRAELTRLREENAEKDRRIAEMETTIRRDMGEDYLSLQALYIRQTATVRAQDAAILLLRDRLDKRAEFIATLQNEVATKDAQLSRYEAAEEGEPEIPEWVNTPSMELTAAHAKVATAWCRALQDRVAALKVRVEDLERALRYIIKSAGGNVPSWVITKTEKVLLGAPEPPAELRGEK